jgi:hypothetical protein
MAEIEVQDGRGVMFEVRGKNEKSPNMRGAFRAKQDIKAGEKIELAGWLKQTRNGNAMVSFTHQSEEWKPPETKSYNDEDGNYRRREPDAIAFNVGKDEDIPF